MTQKALRELAPEHQKLWHALCRFDLNDSSSSYTFCERLALENGWSLAFALGAIEEYKRFIFLICVYDESHTPSEEVDQVWHLHLLYTRSYWDEFCGEILKQKIHHGPTKGGKTEHEKYDMLYKRTTEHYAEVFGEEAPLTYWPSPEKRFAPARWVRVNKQAVWVISKLNF
ncbi:MAG: glycine-rich domain-containing protein [Bacteroidia bacterium]